MSILHIAKKVFSLAFLKKLRNRDDVMLLYRPLSLLKNCYSYLHMRK